MSPKEDVLKASEARRRQNVQSPLSLKKLSVHLFDTCEQLDFVGFTSDSRHRMV